MPWLHRDVLLLSAIQFPSYLLSSSISWNQWRNHPWVHSTSRYIWTACIVSSTVPSLSSCKPSSAHAATSALYIVRYHILHRIAWLYQFSKLYWMSSPWSTSIGSRTSLFLLFCSSWSRRNCFWLPSPFWFHVHISRQLGLVCLCLPRSEVAPHRTCDCTTALARRMTNGSRTGHLNCISSFRCRIWLSKLDHICCTQIFCHVLFLFFALARLFHFCSKSELGFDSLLLYFSVFRLVVSFSRCFWLKPFSLGQEEIFYDLVVIYLKIHVRQLYLPENCSSSLVYGLLACWKCQKIAAPASSGCAMPWSVPPSCHFAYSLQRFASIVYCVCQEVLSGLVAFIGPNATYLQVWDV